MLLYMPHKNSANKHQQTSRLSWACYKYSDRPIISLPHSSHCIHHYTNNKDFALLNQITHYSARHILSAFTEQPASTDGETTKANLLALKSWSNTLGTVAWRILMSCILQSMHCTVTIERRRIEQCKPCVKWQQKRTTNNRSTYWTTPRNCIIANLYTQATVFFSSTHPSSHAIL